jgi:GT2 family glycosyltransferase
MIAFGCAVTQPEAYERWAAPGIAGVREPDSVVYANSSAGSIFRAYNLLLELAGQHEDLEALVLLHQDVEIVDVEFCAKVRQALADPAVGVVGCVGALDARSMAWWEGAVTWASFTHRYYEYGGGELPAFAMHPDRAAPPPYARTGEVDTLDGFILVLSPWSVHELRFDESLGRFHGYDFDFCLQVREAGHKVLTSDLKVVHHHSLELLDDPESWVEANIRLTEKWEQRCRRVGAQLGSASEDWKARARRAEAEAAAARTLRVSAQMRASARERELERELGAMRQSQSWRMTAPLRRIAAGLRSRRGANG